MTRSLLASLALVGALLAPATANAATDNQGPPLSVPGATLDSALHCTGDLTAAQPVLLVPGTTLTDEEFGWNYGPALSAQHRPVCTVTPPGNGMGDIQVSAEYVVHAIRTMSDRAGGKIDVVGHSQGGMVPRWALKFWPDTRSKVDDLVGLAPSNHGTVLAHPLCVPGCAPALWQQRTGSAFLTTLNSDAETWAGIDYTVVYSALDEVVVPNIGDKGSSSLHTGQGRIANIGLQEVCPLRPAEHLTAGTTDSLAYELAMDALDHDGPADPARLAPGACARLLMPGVDPVLLAVREVDLVTTVAEQLLLYPHVTAEPPLADYAR